PDDGAAEHAPRREQDHRVVQQRRSALLKARRVAEISRTPSSCLSTRPLLAITRWSKLCWASFSRCSGPFRLGRVIGDCIYRPNREIEGGFKNTRDPIDLQANSRRQAGNWPTYV